ncbi:MAG: SPFH/Band 7/PHB domain protein [Erysipelotrichaceae bacterium]|jgi:regulator of protease activity HflC (stomatin/prohibitin superfamily)|nr:SPFH/Band 7/PHB domain protein [Erysipelotrichaceae bacterium]
MPGLIIALVVVGVLAILIVVANIKIVKQTEKVIVERLGAYHTTWNVGIHMLIPFIDRVSLRVSMKEQVKDFEPQSVITKDNVTMQIDTVVFFYVTDAKLFAYGVDNPMGAINYLSATTLRNIIGELLLDECLTSREYINEKMTKILDEATDPWGIKVNRVEVKNILPPKDIREAMEKQMRAEREKREKILLSEGTKAAAILVAEGEKQAAILKAEGQKQMAILTAEGQAESLRKVREAEADAVRMLKQAEAQGLKMINEAAPTDEALKLRYFEALGKIADGQATKIFLPSDMANIASASAVFKEVTDKK